MPEAPDRIEDYWCAQYHRRRGARYLGFQARDGVILRKLLKTYGDTAVRWMIRTFLAKENDAYVAAQGWDTRAFQSRARGLYLEFAKKYEQEAKAAKEQTTEQLQAAAEHPQVVSIASRLLGLKAKTRDS